MMPMDLREFFKTVITCPTEGWFLLAQAPQSGLGWYEDWYQWPHDLEKILERVFDVAEESNVYFSTYLFKEPSALKQNVLPTRTIQADLDEADILTLPQKPTILVQTSPGRHQGYWIFEEKWVDIKETVPVNNGTEFVERTRRVLDPPLDLDAHEVLSRKLTYSIKDCDTSGWPLGRKVRVPWTFNFKNLEGPQHIQVFGSSMRQYGEEEIELLDDPPPFLATRSEIDFIDSFGPTDSDSIEEKV